MPQAASLSPKRQPGRPREFDIDAALDAALPVFRERGYHAASLTDLGAAMNLTPGSIYKAFADKRAIFLAAFDRYTEQRGAELDRVVDRQATGLEKLRAALRFYANSSYGLEGRRGCLIAGSAAALAALDAEMAVRVTAALARFERFLCDLIRFGQADASLPADLDADAAARTLLCVLQGMRIVGKTGRSRAEMLAVVDRALRTVT